MLNVATRRMEQKVIHIVINVATRYQWTIIQPSISVFVGPPKNRTFCFIVVHEAPIPAGYAPSTVAQSLVTNRKMSTIVFNSYCHYWLLVVNHCSQYLVLAVNTMAIGCITICYAPQLRQVHFRELPTAREQLCDGVDRFGWCGWRNRGSHLNRNWLRWGAGFSWGQRIHWSSLAIEFHFFLVIVIPTVAWLSLLVMRNYHWLLLMNPRYLSQVFIPVNFNYLCHVFLGPTSWCVSHGWPWRSSGVAMVSWIFGRKIWGLGISLVLNVDHRPS